MDFREGLDIWRRSNTIEIRYHNNFKGFKNVTYIADIGNFDENRKRQVKLLYLYHKIVFDLIHLNLRTICPAKIFSEYFDTYFARIY